MEQLPFEGSLSYFETQKILKDENMIFHVWNDTIVFACRYARRAYHVINESCFAGKLPGAFIGFYDPEDADDLGFGAESRASYYCGAIGFNLAFCPCDKIETISILSHEMVHQYCDLQRITDCIDAYHTESFKKIAESIGLNCLYCDEIYGFNITRVTENFITSLKTPPDKI